MTAHPGIAANQVAEWLSATLPTAVPPFTFELVAAGGSNLTYRVLDSSAGQWALRRPPEGKALETAHDMSREWRIIVALSAEGSVPVPDAIAFCEDPAVTGAPFYVMSFVNGPILRDQQDASRLTTDEATAATQALVDTQVALHRLDFTEIGLGGLARHRDYVGRQLKRWRRQVAAAGVRELPLHSELHARLAASAPPDTRRPALVHGDYRFDNCVMTAQWSVGAVLDWELATIGDPVADFAWSLGYWSDPGDGQQWLTDAPTLAPDFPSRDEYLERYRRGSGLDLSDLGYFEVFSWWKQASIVEGVYARRLAGSTGGMGKRGAPADLAARVDAMLAHAADLASGLI